MIQCAVLLIQILQVIWTREGLLQLIGFTLAGGAISWMLKLQETIDLSTAEVEYITASHACKEAIWQRGLLREIGRL